MALILNIFKYNSTKCYIYPALSCAAPSYPKIFVIYIVLLNIS